jgi:hypothetical protein
MPDASRQCDGQGYIVDESFSDKMDTGTVLVSHIHTVDVSVNCHCVCRTFHTGNTEMMKDGLKGKEIFVKIHLQNKNRNSAVVT